MTWKVFFCANWLLWGPLTLGSRIQSVTFCISLAFQTSIWWWTVAKNQFLVVSYYFLQFFYSRTLHAQLITWLVVLMVFYLSLKHWWWICSNTRRRGDLSNMFGASEERKLSGGTCKNNSFKGGCCSPQMGWLHSLDRSAGRVLCIGTDWITTNSLVDWPSYLASYYFILACIHTLYLMIL